MCVGKDNTCYFAKRKTGCYAQCHKGNEWYIGGICNGEKDERTFQIHLDFLKGNYELTAYQDGINANYQAMHYNKISKSVTSSDVINIKMMRNGGFAAKLIPKK